MRRGAVLLVSVLPAAGTRGAETGYCSEPALHGSRLVFVSEGDLWSATVPEQGAGPLTAYRMTSWAGAESHPVFSPDGSMIAFAGEYGGEADVYVMPSGGGVALRLTFHPGPDMPLAWRADGRGVLFSSPRAQPLGRPELWEVPAAGGIPRPAGFGECSMVAVSPVGRRIAFTRWSDERRALRGDRGGAAPEIWLGDLSTDQFTQLTRDPAVDLHPMWVLGRIWFVSDRTGTANLFSVDPGGGDLKQHTRFAPDPADPVAIEGHDVRWPAADAQQRGRHIVFCQAGTLALLDCVDGTLRRLDVRLASDRPLLRPTFAEALSTVTEYALSPRGEGLVVVTRGDLLYVPTSGGAPRQLTSSSFAREWGASFLDEQRIVLITDAPGEQQVAMAPPDGSSLPMPLTENLEAWLFPPRGSPDGKWLAFGDCTGRVHVMNMATFDHRQIDQSQEHSPTDDYRFSPDGQWLAYSKVARGGARTIHVHALRTGRAFQVSDGRNDAREPCWDPAGKYLYFIGAPDPLGSPGGPGGAGAQRICAVPLARATPPPLPEVARRAGFDLRVWSAPPAEEVTAPRANEPAAGDPDGAGAGGQPPPESRAIQVDAEGLAERLCVLPLEAGTLWGLEAVRGGVLYLSEPAPDACADGATRPGWGTGKATLHHYDLAASEARVLAGGVSGYALAADGTTVAYPVDRGFAVIELGAPQARRLVDLSGLRLPVDVRAEWRHAFAEAWRIERDFPVAPDRSGADWPAIRSKYTPLVDRVGSREELDDVIGAMLGERGAKLATAPGGDPHRQTAAVAAGLLGADIQLDPQAGAVRITRILPRPLLDERFQSPLAAPHLGVKEGAYLLAVDGVPLSLRANIHELLQDRAGRVVALTIVEDATGRARRTVEVGAIASERALRYAAWVESGRRRVEEAAEGRLGYVHVPGADVEGLAVLGGSVGALRGRDGLVVDLRGTAGALEWFALVGRLERESRAADRAAGGSAALRMVLLIDEHTGPGGDLLAESFRAHALGPVVGTRTAGGPAEAIPAHALVDRGTRAWAQRLSWETLRGGAIRPGGTIPDIDIQITPADRAAGRDPQLEKAIEVLLAGPREAPTQPGGRDPRRWRAGGP